MFQILTHNKIRLTIPAFVLFFLMTIPGISEVQSLDFGNDPTIRQVAIEALVVEINDEYTRNLGLSYTLNRDELTNPSNNLKAIDVRFPFKPDDVEIPTFSDADNDRGFNLGTRNALPGFGISLSGMDVAIGEVTANLRALLLSGNAEIRAHTIAVALHNSMVSIETVDEVPFQDVKYGKNGQPNLDVSYEKVGVRLQAKPVIKDIKKGRISLDIREVNLSSVTGFVTLQNVNRPIFARSSANTTIEITSGETFFIGGFKTKRDVVSESGVPFLRRIPILGYLFKSEKKVQENKDILFFITPYLLNPGTNPILPYDFEHAEYLTIHDVNVSFE